MTIEIEESMQIHGPHIARIELTPLFVPFWEFVRETMQAVVGGLGMDIPAE